MHTHLRLVSAPLVEAVSVEVAKAAAKIEHADDDHLIRTWLNAATRAALVHTGGRQLITATYALDLPAFPGDPSAAIELPRPPLRSIDSITYYDTAGDEQTLDDESYYTIAPLETAGLLYLVPGATWPATQCRANAATITFDAGYGDTPDSVPESILAGILALVGFWNRNRDASLDEIPAGVLSLFRSCRAGGYP